MRIEVEGACDHEVEAIVHRFARGSHEIAAPAGAELRSDEDRSAALDLVAFRAFHEAAFGTNLLARPGDHAFELDAVALVLLLDAFALEVLDHDGGEVVVCAVILPFSFALSCV